MPLRIDETGCYKDENCRRHSERQEKIDFNQRFKDSLPIINNLAIQKGSLLLTRKFALIPAVQNPIERKRTYSKMTDIFVKITSLKNVYIQKLIDHAQDGHLNDFTNSSKLSAQKLFGKLNFTRLDGLSFSKSISNTFQLKERVKRCAHFEAYEIVRNWLIRNENLKAILEYLISKFENDDAFVVKFLEGKRFSSNEIKDIRNMLGKNCFEKRQMLSTFYLNNHIYQLRNIFFRTFDFPAALLHNPKNLLQKTISKTFLTPSSKASFIESIANGFTQKQKKRTVDVPENKLFDYLLNLYFRKLKSSTTRMAQRIIILRYRSHKMKDSINLQSTKDKLFSIIKLFQFTTKKQFIDKRNEQIDDMKAQFQESINSFTRDDLYQLITNLFNDEINLTLRLDNQYILRHVFRPSFPNIKISKLSFTSLMEYVKTKIRYKIREHLKYFFMTDDIVRIFMKGLRYMKENLFNLLSVPKVKQFSLNLIDGSTFRDNYNDLEFELGFISRNFIRFAIIDQKNRLQKFMEKFTPANPTITFKHRKLLLNLPFEAKKRSLKSFQENGQSSSNLEMGVDLGLKHPAVLSIWDKVGKREVARYFLSWKNLFDKKLIEQDTWFTDDCSDLKFKKTLKWQNQTRFNTISYNKQSNIKLKLIDLRNQIKLLQRKKNNYEQRLLSSGVSNFRSKLKWNKIRGELSLCWNRINNINCQIVNLVNHFTIQIAKFHGVIKIKMEDLRFAKHSKKSNSGKFIAFWQTHWFFSQVQDAIKLQCKLNGIRFQKVSAGYTSQRCSRCGKLGSRDGKHFYCTECELTIDSDLNASRNIVQYDSSANQAVISQVYFNEPIW